MEIQPPQQGLSLIDHAMTIFRLGRAAMLAGAMAVAACGGGGGDEGPPVDLEALIGSDASVTFQPIMICFRGLIPEDQTTGRLSGRMDVEQVGPGRLLATFSDTSGGNSFSYDLRYVSGDNVSGYVFNGTATNTLSGEQFEVFSASIRNSVTTGLAIVGTITVRDFGAFCGTTYSIR